MLKKNNSGKATNVNRNYHSGNEIINKLENLYNQSINNMHYSSQIITNNFLFKNCPPLKKKISLKEQKSFTKNNLNNTNKKSLYRYSSLDSLMNKNSQKKKTKVMNHPQLMRP